MKLRILRLKPVLFLLGAILPLAFTPDAMAITTLKKVQITDGSQIDLFFDGKITESQIKTEFFNDIVQLSLNDVSVYPAKITSVSGMDLTKVFAYQYSPKLVRCRLTVRGKAEDYQERVKVKLNGKMLSIRIQEGEGTSAAKDSVASSAAQTRVVPGSAEDKSPAAQARRDQDEKISPDERVLLDRVMKGSATTAAAQGAHKEASKGEKADKSQEKGSDSQPQTKLAGGKPLPSPFRSMGMLALVVGLFVAGAFAFRRFKARGIENHKGFAGFLGKMSSLGIPAIGGKKRMIEVMATHYLGPKKSIAVVRIGSRQLVLGVTNESINLIAQLPEQGGSDFDGVDQLDLETLAMESMGIPASNPAPSPAVSHGGPTLNNPHNPYAAMRPKSNPVPTAPPASAGFSDYLNAERSKPSVRAQIRNRVEGLKQL